MTAPLVARSIAIHRLIGTGRMPLTICHIYAGDKPVAADNAACRPRTLR